MITPKEVSTLLAFAVVMATACNTPPAEEATAIQSVEIDAVGVTAEEHAENPEPSMENWQSDPVAVMDAVFEAARTKDYSKLAGLCDPEGTGDGDTKQICSVSFAPEAMKDQFVQAFMYGQVIGKPVVVGDTAMVQIKFGQQGARDESMRMIRRGGNWYLESF